MPMKKIEQKCLAYNKTSKNGMSALFAISANPAIKGCYRTKLKPVTKYAHQLLYILLYIFNIHRYKYGDASIKLRSLNFWFTL